MTIIKRAFAIILATVLLLFITAGGSLVAFAEESPETSESPVIVQTETEITDVAEQFKNYLKDKYGSEYDYYYSAIIQQWGSIESYLLAFGNKLPEEAQSGWDKFVGWLREYAVIWVPILAVIAVIVAVILGKSKIKKLKEWLAELVKKFVNKRFTAIENELNLQSKAIAATLHSQKALLGSSEKYADNVKELEAADKELTDG